ncbi:MAG TPA: beta-galactosidase, partial [Armatimonadota bacterium]|nr:beta-galactosidase [Armatimonadota bacterium]
RGLTPKRSDWGRDMATMRSLGFNTIRAWLVWGVLEPAPGEIDTGYLDDFLDQARDHGLQVGFLFHLHGCPEWAISRFQKYWYIGEEGQPFEPSARANTPSGGWPGLCPDYPEVQELEASFMSAVADHVGARPEVAFWEPINEPHMWIELAKNPPGTFCYCPATRALFRKWLQAKYGDLAALGEAWGRRFCSWDDVRPPTWRFGFTDWVDWRTFTAENITALVDRRARVIRAHSDKPVIGHAWGGGSISCHQLGAMAFDDWKNAAVLDKWGYSAFPGQASQTMMVGLGTDATRNAAAGKEFWQSELGAGDYGCGMDRDGRVPPELLAMWSWESLRHGAKGLLYWQFRKEAHGAEFGAFGLSDYAGKPTENARMAATIGKTLNENAELFNNAQYPQPEVGILFSFQDYMTDWAQHRQCQLSMDSISGYYRMLWEENIPVDIIHEETATAESLARYKAIILPMPIALAAPIRTALKAYIAAGGTVISDPYLCAFDANKALAEEVPGDGFADIFGCREHDINLAKGRTFTLVMDGTTREITGGHLHAWWDTEASTTVLARYADTTPAITANSYGKGRAIIFGLNLGLAYSTQEGVGDDFVRNSAKVHGADSKAIVLELLQEAGIHTHLTTPQDVRASVLTTSGDEAVLIAINFAKEQRSGTIALSGTSFTAADDLLTGTAVTATGSTVSLDFAPYETRVLRLSGCTTQHTAEGMVGVAKVMSAK